MTDKEKLTDLLTEFGVEFHTDEDGDVWCDEGTRGVEGCAGYSVAFEFHECGTFKKMGAWT